MQALFVHDTHYSRDQNTVYAHGVFPYALWSERYLPHFENLTIIGREKIFSPHENLPASHGAHVEFNLLPNINTPLKRLRASKTKARIAQAVANADAVIIRGPVEFGMIAASAARKLNKPVAIEMSGCAFDHTWAHHSALAKLYAPVKFARAQNMLKHADYVAYVTENFLQSRYPTNGINIAASNVEIEPVSPEILQKRLAKITQKQGKTIFGLIGNYSNNLKGLSVLFEAFSKIKTALPPFEIRILGQGESGRWIGRLDALKLTPHVRFDPPVNGAEKISAWLDDIDIYLQPSLHEGLPRALIEAMSRGLPALASDAGGIPELLPPENIHPRRNARIFSQNILKSLSIDWQKQNAALNFYRAQNYTRDVLVPRRKKFWSDFAAYAKARRSAVS